MTVIDVERIRFEFGASWTIVEKWDNTDAFRHGVCKLQDSKAVDIVGVRDGDLYLIEVKDYRGYAIESKARQSNELPLVMGCKVRDTIAGLVGASRMVPTPWLDTCAGLLLEKKQRVYVVAWVADPAVRPSEPLQKRDTWMKTRRDGVKQRLSWLTSYVQVENPFNGRVGDVVAQNLPGAGQR